MERSFLFVSSWDPEASRHAVEASPLEIDLAVISPSKRARETADYAAAGPWVFTVEEPLLVERVFAESGADVLARLAQALRGLAAYDARAPLVVLDLLGAGAFALDETGLAALRAGGYKPLHDEAAAFASGRVEAGSASGEAVDLDRIRWRERLGGLIHEYTLAA